MSVATAVETKPDKSASFTVAVVFTAYMAVVFGLGLYLFSLLASEMRQTLGFGTRTVGAITASAQVAFLLAALLCPRLTRRFGEGRVIVLAVGMLADRVGIKRTLALSYAILGTSAVLVAVHSDVGLLYAAAICFGLSFFAVYGLIPAYITKSFAEDQTTAVFAGANICLGLGTALGNLVSGFIPDLSGSLQQVYFGIACVAGAAAILVAALPKEGTAASG